jgi:hypothetical protein
MKISELKSEIKNYIYEILSEGPPEDQAEANNIKAVKALIDSLKAQLALLNNPNNQISSGNPQKDSQVRNTKKASIESQIKALNARLATLNKPGNQTLGEEKTIDEAQMVSIADKEALEFFKEKSKNKLVAPIIDVVLKAGDSGITKKAIANALGFAGQQSVNPIVNMLITNGILKTSGTPDTPSAPKEKIAKEKIAKEKVAKVKPSKGEEETDIEDTYYKADADDISFDDEKEPSKKDIEKEKIATVSKFKIPQEKFEDFKLKLKTVVDKIKSMPGGDEKDRKMAALKQFIKNPELVKAFKERDVTIDTGDLIG